MGSGMPQPEETLKEILRYARERGCRPSPHQIHRYQQNGLIPKPRLVGLGQGKGTEARYQHGTGAQLVAALKAAKSKSFRLARWRLWWEGWRIDSAWIKKDLFAHVANARKRPTVPRSVRRRLIN